MVAVTMANTIGSAYLGVVASAILFGVTNMQTYFYYRRYAMDRWLHKGAVGLLWVLDALHLGLTVHAVYHYTIESFGNVLALDIIVWSFKLQIAINVAIIVLVQSLYAARVWTLGYHRNKFLPIAIVGIVALGYAVGIILTVETYRIHRFSGLAEIAWAIYMSFATSTAVDAAITGAMCFYLGRSRSAFARTDSTIATLMQYVLASGLATSACSLAALIAYALLPETLVFLGIEFLLTKLYVNSFLAMLNARTHIGTRSDDGTGSRSLSQLRAGAGAHGVASAGGAAEADKEFIALGSVGAHRIARFDALPADSKAYAWPGAGAHAV